MRYQKRAHEAGFTLIETMIACIILTICSTGILSLFAISIVKNANRGDYATRTTEYAQDKMEQLMSLQFVDTTSNTINHSTDGITIQPPCLNLSMSTFSTCSPAGTGLNTVPGGSISSNVVGYVDYIALNSSGGAWVSSDYATGASFVRRWSIVFDPADSTNSIKTISVSVTSLTGLAMASSSVRDGLAPETTLMSQKTGIADTF